jgi:hypothetical protein
LHVSGWRKFGRRRIWDSRRVIEGSGDWIGEGMRGKAILLGGAGQVDADDADGVGFFFAMKIRRRKLSVEGDTATAVFFWMRCQSIIARIDDFGACRKIGITYVRKQAKV